MRLLFDQNLSRRLVNLLAAEYPRSVHVTGVGLEMATDREIWDHAALHELVIVSKDSDFRQLAFLHGPPPKAVWVRTGNASTSEIAQRLRDRVDELERFVADHDEALLVLD